MQTPADTCFKAGTLLNNIRYSLSQCQTTTTTTTTTTTSASNLLCMHFDRKITPYIIIIIIIGKDTISFMQGKNNPITGLDRP
jgi:hypothetical protein